MENLSGAQTIRRPVLLINRPVERYILYRRHLSSLVLGGNWNINGNPAERRRNTFKMGGRYHVIKFLYPPVRWLQFVVFGKILLMLIYS